MLEVYPPTLQPFSILMQLFVINCNVAGLQNSKSIFAPGNFTTLQLCNFPTIGISWSSTVSPTAHFL